MRKPTRKRKATKKVQWSDTEPLDRARHIDWIVMEKILFRITHCHRCGAEPGPLHAAAHAAWVAEVRSLEAMLALPSRKVES